MVEDLAGVVEDAAGGLLHDIHEVQALETAAGEELEEVVDIGLEVLAVVEGDGLRADGRRQRFGRIRQVDEFDLFHIV